MKNKIEISFLFLIVLFIAGCSEYRGDFSFTGSVEEILVEEEMLVIKEYGGVDKGRKDGNIYEIPVEGIGEYSIGQKLEITVFSNADDDVWDLDNMKFVMKTVND